MQELIQVSTNSQGVQVVSARALHEFLGATERFSSWCKRMFDYGLAEGQDFTTVKSFTVVNNGAKKDILDYALTIDAAKEISMLQRSERGKQARQYFIECERQLKARPLPTAKELAMLVLQSESETEALRQEINRLRFQNRKMKEALRKALEAGGEKPARLALPPAVEDEVEVISKFYTAPEPGQYRMFVTATDIRDDIQLLTGKQLGLKRVAQALIKITGKHSATVRETRYKTNRGYWVSPRLLPAFTQN